MQPETTTMSMSEAMDVLDEFHIKRSDYSRVMAAMEAVFGGGDEAELAPDADNGQALASAKLADQAMADEMFASGRNRRA